MSIQGKMKGRARIYMCLPDDVWPAGVDVPKAGRIVYDLMETVDLFEKWKTFLLLPESYAIIGVFFDVTYYRWLVIVESDSIPLPDRGAMLPELMPTYQRQEDGTVSVVKLDLLRSAHE